MGSTDGAACGAFRRGLVRIDGDGRAPSSHSRCLGDEGVGSGLGGRADGGMCDFSPIDRFDLAPQSPSVGDGTARLPLPSCWCVSGPARRSEVRATARGRPRLRQRSSFSRVWRAAVESLWSRAICRKAGHAPHAGPLPSGRCAGYLRHRLGSLHGSSSHPLGRPLPDDAGVERWAKSRRDHRRLGRLCKANVQHPGKTVRFWG